jgi:hypothetical protein
MTLIVLAALAGCQGRPAGTGAAGYVNEDDYQSQVDAFNRQTEQHDREMERVSKQSDRVDKLLDKQEEQVKRWEAILDAEEKRLGIKP